VQKGSIVEGPDVVPRVRVGGDDEALRVRLHAMWAAVATGWERHADYVDARGADVTAAMLDRAQLRSGERVLELASGPGGVGIAAAPLVAPGGEVVVSDVAVEMTAIAAARASARGLGSVSTRVLDLERIDEPDASYDVVLCREGLMFAPDPARAAREIHRVLRPGGRAVVAVWGPRERNPWLGLVFAAVTAQTGAPVPPPGVPGPFSLGSAPALATLLADAGLTAVDVGEVPTPLRASSFEEWWERTAALAGPLAAILAAMPAAARDALTARLRAAIVPYRVGDCIEVPGVTLVATGRR